VSAVGPILVVDDDEELCDLLSDYLGQEGWAVEAVHDGERGLLRATSGRHALIILDVMLPGMDGLEVLRRLRQASTVPVLMLTARGEEVDRITGLELGADDYLGKPFNPRELVARIRAIQRRLDLLRVDTRTLSAGDIELDLAGRTARLNGRVLELTSAELALLTVLLRALGTVVSREALSLDVLGRRLSPNDRALDVHVSNLRRKLGRSASGGERVKTVRGVGYVYTAGEVAR
jgi:two-component system, OmpR family, response regulator CpxR